MPTTQITAIRASRAAASRRPASPLGLADVTIRGALAASQGRG